MRTGQTTASDTGPPDCSINWLRATHRLNSGIAPHHGRLRFKWISAYIRQPGAGTCGGE